MAGAVLTIGIVEPWGRIMAKRDVVALSAIIEPREGVKAEWDVAALSGLITKHEAEFLTVWLRNQLDAGSLRSGQIKEDELEDQSAEIAIIDITGVPVVDTLVAQHIVKTTSAARLMGADCIISGIRPQIAQTIVHLGLQLDVVSKATIADAFALALKRTGQAVSRDAGSASRGRADG